MARPALRIDVTKKDQQELKKLLTAACSRYVWFCVP